MGAVRTAGIVSRRVRGEWAVLNSRQAASHVPSRNSSVFSPERGHEVYESIASLLLTTEALISEIARELNWPALILRVRERQMADLLHKQRTMSDRFISHMLTRNIRIEEDLIDQLFNSSEKRLARTLLLLARYRKQAIPVRMVPKISQDTLAEMVGTTRSRVNFFLNNFKKLGFIEYHGEMPIKINSSLLSVVLHD